MLVVPLELATCGIEGKGCVGVERVVLRAGFERQQAIHFGNPWIRLSDAEKQGFRIRVVSAGVPRRSAVALFERYIVPGVSARLSRAGDGVETPRFGAGLRVMRRDETTAGLGIAATRHPLNDLAPGDERAAGVAPPFGPVGSGLIPSDLAGVDVEGDEVRVRGGDDEVAVDDRHAALGERIAALGDQDGRQVTLVLPQQIAIGGVQGLYLVAIVEDKQHAIMDDGCDFRRPVGQGPGPRNLHSTDVGLLDLFQGTVAPAVVGASPHQPVRWRWVAEHFFGYRREGPGCRGRRLLCVCERSRHGEEKHCHDRLFQFAIAHQ